MKSKYSFCSLIFHYTFMFVYNFFFLSDNKIAYGEIIEKLLKMQLELESNLSNSLSEKEHALENLKKTTSLVKNEIINQYKVNLKY